MRILPVPSPLSAPFWQAAREHRLVVQSCDRCGHLQHPPAPICEACRSSELSFSEMSGRATLYSFTVVHHSVHPATIDKVPYVLALAELEEGPRLLANLRHVEPEDLEQGRLGVAMALMVVFEDLTDEVTLVQFAPSPGAQTR